MNFKGNYILFLLFMVSTAWWSCRNGDDPGFQSPPEISFLGFEKVKSPGTGKDSLLVLKIGYKDENGDLGLSLTDTGAPYNQGLFRYNLWIDIMDLDNGGEDTIKVPGTSFNQIFHQRIPDLRPSGRNKYVEGEIEVSYDASSLTIYPNTVKVYLQMVDRRLQLSNKVNSGPIQIEH